MASKQAKDRQEDVVISAQESIDSAPIKGRFPYLRLPKEIGLFEPKIGQLHEILILPWKPGKNNPKHGTSPWVVTRFINVHDNLGPDNDKALCCHNMLGTDCEVCTFLGQYRQGKSWEQMQQVVQALGGRDREIMLVHDIKGPYENLKIWNESIHNFGNYLRQKAGRNERNLKYADFKDGMVIEIKGEPKKIGKGKEFPVFTTIEFISRLDYKSDPMTKELKDLCYEICPDDFLVFPDQEKLGKLVYSIGSIRTPAGGGRDEEPARRPRRDDPEDSPRRGRVEPEESPRRGREEEPPARGRRDEEPVREEREAPARGRREEPAEESPRRGRDEPAREEPPARGRREEPAEESPRRGRGEEAPARGREPEEESPRRGRATAEEEPVRRRAEPEEESPRQRAAREEPPARSREEESPRRDRDEDGTRQRRTR